MHGGRASRLLAAVAVALGSAAFSMQDILLEPYGAQIMGLPVAATSALTALMAGGSLAAFALASRWLYHGGDPCRLAAFGALAGVVAFAAVIFADSMGSPLLFRFGAILIGFGGGFFSVGILTAAMGLETHEHNGVILYLDGLPRWTFKWTMPGASFLPALALLGLYVTAKATRITGTCLAFTFAIIVWA